MTEAIYIGYSIILGRRDPRAGPLLLCKDIPSAISPLYYPSPAVYTQPFPYPSLYTPLPYPSPQPSSTAKVLTFAALVAVSKLTVYFWLFRGFHTPPCGSIYGLIAINFFCTHATLSQKVVQHHSSN